MRLWLLLLLGVSTATFAHPGHDLMIHSSLLAGMLHPFTGLDHLTMGLGLGLLMARTFRQARFTGLALLLVALAGGFMLGIQHLVDSRVAEYGIILSLVVLAVALWQRVGHLYLPFLALLGVFHGIAHGNELAAGVHPLPFMLGMMMSLALLYLLGVMIGRWLLAHLPVSQRLAALAAGLVAVFEFAA